MPGPTDPRAQLCGGVITITGVLLVGFIVASVLGPRVDEGRALAQEEEAGRWVSTVVDELGGGIVIDDPSGDGPLTVVPIRLRDGEFVRAFRWVAPNGYNGAIDIALVVDGTGTITAMRVLEHQETIGFGDVISEENSPWIHGFVGRSLSRPRPSAWRLTGDGGAIDGISGATITANAVVNGVFDALRSVEDERKTTGD